MLFCAGRERERGSRYYFFLLEENPASLGARGQVPARGAQEGEEACDVLVA